MEIQQEEIKLHEIQLTEGIKQLQLQRQQAETDRTIRHEHYLFAIDDYRRIAGLAAFLSTPGIQTRVKSHVPAASCLPGDVFPLFADADVFL